MWLSVNKEIRYCPGSCEQKALIDSINRFNLSINCILFNLTPIINFDSISCFDWLILDYNVVPLMPSLLTAFPINLPVLKANLT
jgi:hypothetical protein